LKQIKRKKKKPIHEISSQEQTSLIITSLGGEKRNTKTKRQNLAETSGQGDTSLMFGSCVVVVKRKRKRQKKKGKEKRKRKHQNLVEISSQGQTSLTFISLSCLILMLLGEKG